MAKWGGNVYLGARKRKKMIIFFELIFSEAFDMNS